MLSNRQAAELVDRVVNDTTSYGSHRIGVRGIVSHAVRETQAQIERNTQDAIRRFVAPEEDLHE